MRRIDLSVTGVIAMLLVGTLGPAFVAAGVVLLQQWDAQRRAVDDELQRTVAVVSEAVDAEFRTALARLQTAAADEALVAGRWEAFYRFARSSIDDFDGALIGVTSRDGQMLVNTAVPWGTRLPNLWSMEDTHAEIDWEGRRLPLSSQGLCRKAFETGRPQHSDLYYGVSIRRPTLAVCMPVRESPSPRVALILSYPPTALAALLTRSTNREGLRLALLDRSGRVVATNGSAATRIGERTTESTRDIPRGPGLYERVARDGTHVIGAFARSEATGFTIRAALPRTLAYQQAQRATAIWAGVTLLVTLIGTAIALSTARRITDGLRRLNAVALGAADPGSTGLTSLREIDAVAASLERARVIESRHRDEALALRVAQEQRAAVESSERRLRRVVDHMFAFVAVLRVDGVLLEANRAPLELAGLTREDVVGTPFWDCPWWTFDPDVRARIRGAVERAAAGETVRFDVPLRLAGDGRITIDFQLAPVRDDDGRITMLVHSSVDITDRVAAADALQRSERELMAREAALREADRQKDAFIATLAHELRNPLAPIRTCGEIIQRRRPSDAAIAKAGDTIVRQAGHLKRLVDDLLDVSRIRWGEITLQRQCFDLREAVTSAADSARPTLAAHGLALACELPPSPVPVDGDPARLLQVVANLLDNAAKFTPAGGDVRVQLRVEADRAELRVQDSGVGIAAEARQRIFEPFVQLRQAGHAGHSGLGIGLALVRQLVERHGGDVSVDSGGTDQGATFLVRLPLAPAEALGPPARSQGPSASAREILVVDDNADAAQSLASLLSLHGHRVTVAHSGREAIERFRALRPPVVVLDLGLPDCSGYEVARRIREIGGAHGTRLIALTGWGQASDMDRSRAAGFDAHLTKPVDLATLDAMLLSAA